MADALASYRPLSLQKDINTAYVTTFLHYQTPALCKLSLLVPSEVEVRSANSNNYTYLCLHLWNAINGQNCVNLTKSNILALALANLKQPSLDVLYH